MPTSAYVRGRQIAAFNAACATRGLPLQIIEIGARARPWFALRDATKDMTIQVSHYQSVILFLGLARALDDFRTDLGGEVLVERAAPPAAHVPSTIRRARRRTPLFAVAAPV